MRNLSVILFSAILLTACSDKKEDTSVIEKQVSKKEASSLNQDALTNVENEKLTLIGTNQLIAKSKKDLAKKALEGIKLQSNTKSILINEQKFELLSEELLKGAKVYNFLMSQAGIVKGTFVVITSNVDRLSHFDNTVEINEIAKSTYRLTPEKNVDFLGYYDLLKEAEQFTRVEMEIDYSGKTDHPLTEEQ
jgi:hypothetical protein